MVLVFNSLVGSDAKSKKRLDKKQSSLLKSRVLALSLQHKDFGQMKNILKANQASDGKSRRARADRARSGGFDLEQVMCILVAVACGMLLYVS